jgi:CheY-like chemotaxis protein
MAYQALIVDDDPSSRLFLKLTLELIQFAVTEAENGAAAMSLLEQRSPDLVLLDMLLPQVSGLDILKYIHEAPHLAKTRVIVLSAHDQYRDALRPHDQYIVKPVSASRLRQAAQDAISGRG